MENKTPLTILVILIMMLSGYATIGGIFSSGGEGNYTYESIRGETVVIYGKGLYAHMSADVAIQGIAQDIITLFLGIPVLLLALIGARRGSVRSRFLLTGTAMYFFVTYLFYMAMGMYNSMFLVYVCLAGLSLFTLFLLLIPYRREEIPELFSEKTPAKTAGTMLMVISGLIALLWLSAIVPPLLDGSIYPENLDHYTTMIVQGFDLGLLLPIAFVLGVLLRKRSWLGYLAGTVYWVFLAFLMTALTAKLVAMGLHDVNIIPAVFIIPLFNLVAIIMAIRLLRALKKTSNTVTH